jgi:hypothetical protein
VIAETPALASDLLEINGAEQRASEWQEHHQLPHTPVRVGREPDQVVATGRVDPRTRVDRGDHARLVGGAGVGGQAEPEKRDGGRREGPSSEGHLVSVTAWWSRVNVSVLL